MFGWGRPRRDVPQVNYNESSSSEEEFEDGLNFDNVEVNLVPAVPVHTRAGSPVDLAHPTLNDNVDEDLEEVAVHLGDIQQVEEEIEELTDLLEGIDTKVSDKKVKTTANQNKFGEAIEHDPEEEVIEFNLEVEPDSEVAADNMPPAAVPVNFDAEEKEDGDKAADNARHIKVEFDPNDIRFWFVQLED